MIIVYIVVTAFVMVLLLSVPLFPFWKVWQRMKSHHPDIWQSAGPFEPQDMIKSPGLAGIFVQVIIRMVNDKALLDRDPVIVKWCRVAMEVVHMMPRTWPSRITYLIVFLYFTSALTKLLLMPFSA
jgi:hypothetical protein